MHIGNAVFDATQEVYSIRFRKFSKKKSTNECKLATNEKLVLIFQVGTCKMGPKFDPYAVVNPRLQVYGIKHLRVVDSSIMPEIVAGHTNAATYMIGEKASDMIKEDWLNSVYE